MLNQSKSPLEPWKRLGDYRAFQLMESRESMAVYGGLLGEAQSMKRGRRLRKIMRIFFQRIFQIHETFFIRMKYCKNREACTVWGRGILRDSTTFRWGENGVDNFWTFFMDFWKSSKHVSTCRNGNTERSTALCAAISWAPVPPYWLHGAFHAEAGVSRALATKRGCYPSWWLETITWWIITANSWSSSTCESKVGVMASRRDTLEAIMTSLKSGSTSRTRAGLEKCQKYAKSQHRDCTTWGRRKSRYISYIRQQKGKKCRS